MNTARGKRFGRVENAGPTDDDPEATSRVRSYVVIFTETEKREELRGQIFRGGHFDGVDFSNADLSFVRFQDVTLTGCNFARANLRGVTFVRCDVRWSAFERARLGKNRFELAFFAGCTGLTNRQRQYVQRHGGIFALDGPGGRA